MLEKLGFQQLVEETLTVKRKTSISWVAPVFRIRGPGPGHRVEPDLPVEHFRHQRGDRAAARGNGV
jgi:hypothetical protein